ncbi:MAG: hypothetical protein QNJ35_13800 [Paracoccaceae bacterium]|nr:hypothetical protein [Paracoccaceae bacterium]
MPDGAPESLSSTSLRRGGDAALIRSRAAMIAWCSILGGALSGMVMGLWSFNGPFPTPDWIGPYDSLPRRFLRLAHIAMFALGILHMLVARQITEAPVRPDLDRLALRSILIGNIGMPAVLIAATIWQPLKYLAAIPSTAVTVAIAICALSAIRRRQGDTT